LNFEFAFNLISEKYLMNPVYQRLDYEEIDIHEKHVEPGITHGENDCRKLRSAFYSLLIFHRNMPYFQEYM